MRKRISGSIVLYFILATAMVAFVMLLWRLYDGLTFTSAIPKEGLDERCVILDAGHGGKDGGAVSLTGRAEKEINLEAAKGLEAILTAQGYEVIMTRDDDFELTVEGSSASRKMQDIKGRLMIADRNPSAVFISIHMNKFPKERYYGTQIYHAESDSSRMLAESAMKSVKKILQTDNEREIKKTTSSIYLLSHIKNPAVLIEYGFISNEAEAKKLEDAAYLRSLNLSLYLGLADGGM